MLILASCAQLFRANIVHKAEGKLIGSSKLDLYECAGTPSRRDVVKNVEFLTYVGKPHNGREGCEATFMIRNNIIRKVSYSGSNRNWASKVEQCASILEGCI